MGTRRTFRRRTHRPGGRGSGCRRRPLTYSRRVIAPAWTTVLPTPPFPEYVSAHSGQSAAALAALEDVVGTDVSFTDHAHDADGFAPRTYSHIFAAAEEAGLSRVYAG